MAVSMYPISVPVFVKHLNGLAGCLKKLLGLAQFDVLHLQFRLMHVQLVHDGLECRFFRRAGGFKVLEGFKQLRLRHFSSPGDA